MVRCNRPRCCAIAALVALLSATTVSVEVDAASITAAVTIADPEGPSDSATERDPALVHPSLQIPPGTGARGPSFAEAYGDETGRVRAFARTGAEAYEATAFVQWEATIRKDEENPFFEFTITPGFLEILHGVPASGEDLVRPPYAEMAIIVFDNFDAGEIFFEHYARIEGVGGDIDTETFELVYENGDLVGSTTYEERVFPNPLFPDPVDQARYETPSVTGIVDLSGLAIGETLRVGYTIEVEVGGDGEETAASAFIGDPLDLSSGITTRTSGVTLLPEPTTAVLLLLGAIAARRRARR